ncbi:HdeD family acid-resistance protein [Apibacter sp.]|uniref:HdeD family acid-resistance protein n=1 Tax=Apibacter sp. TaxID=2023709 RepID=UPI0025E162D2|nr:DUF308 domain-containing protein [Apibacter sp.]MCT6869749.1 DUF308 domain-containing protein [Apibacter sp.]
MKSFIKNWWIMLLLGILFILAGIIVMASPTPSLIFLTTFFSVSFLVFGLFEIVFSLSNTHTDNWGWYLAGGILDLLVGIILISSNIFTQMGILSFFIGFWLMFKGVSLIGHSFDIKNLGISNWGWLLALGILEVILSFIIVMFPPIGLAALLIWVSVSMLFLGIYYISLAFSVKKIKNKIV